MAILILPLVVLAVGALVVIAKVILGPISSAAGNLNAPTKFRLSDFFWLVVQLQLVLAVISQTMDPSGAEVVGYWAMVLLFLALTTLMWGGAVSCVSKAGVTNAWRRGLFILWQLPATLALMIAIPASVIGAANSFWTAFINQAVTHQKLDLSQFGIYASVVILLCALAWGLRFISKWVVGSIAVHKPLNGPPPMEAARL